MSEETLRMLCLQVRNWGKWGPDNELGTLNYITPVWRRWPPTAPATGGGSSFSSRRRSPSRAEWGRRSTPMR
jgi:hypothetical protein